MDDAKPPLALNAEQPEAVRKAHSPSSPPTMLAAYSTPLCEPANAVSTPTLVLLWAAIHALVVLDPAPVHPFLPRFLSTRLWFELQARLRLAPPAIPIGRTQDTLRWAAEGPSRSATWAYAEISGHPQQAALYLLWMGIMRAWNTVAHVQSLPGRHGQLARALSVPLTSVAGSHLHIGEVNAALLLLLLTEGATRAGTVAAARADVVGRALRLRDKRVVGPIRVF
ncbi:unnamed protein product [Cutaneotrichosporon oleaginosum]